VNADEALKFLQSFGYLRTPDPWADSDTPVQSGELVETILSAMAQEFMPRPFLSDTQALRAAHEDLGNLSDFALWAEAERSKFLLAWGRDTTGWITERYKAINGEIAQRRGNHG
jgi:hypothetical protein